MRLQGRKKSFGQTAKRSAVWDFGGRILSQGTLFVVSVFLARLLTPADFGITAAARFFVTMASRVTQLGLNVSLVRMKEIRPEHASTVFVTNLVLGVLAFLTLYGWSGAIGRYFGSEAVAEVLPVTAVAFLINPFGTVPNAMLNRHLRYRTSTVIQLADNILGTLCSLGLALFGFSYWSLVFGPIVGAVLSTAAKFYVSPWRPSLRFSRSALRDTLSFGVGFQAKRLLQFGSDSFDNVLVGRTLGIVALGYYDKAYGLMLQLTDRMAFDSTLMRIFAIIHDDPERFRNALLKGIQAMTILTFPVLAFAGIAAEELIIVLFGPNWLPAVGPFRVMAIVGMLRSALRPLNAANDALGLVWLQTVHQLVFFVLMVTGVSIGLRWGVTGAAVGLLPAGLVNVVVVVRLLTRNSDVTTGDVCRAVWPASVMLGLMCMAVLAVRFLMDYMGSPGAWATLPAMLLVAGGTYVGLLLWTPFPTVAALVRESADDITPWIRRWVVVGVLRERSSDIVAASGVGE